MISTTSMRARLRYILYLLGTGTVLLVLFSAWKNDTYDLEKFDKQGQENTQLTTLHSLNPVAATHSNFLNTSEYSNKPDPEEQRYERYCPPTKCAYGHWVPRVPQFTTYEEAFHAITYNPNGLEFPLPEPHPPLVGEGIEMSEEEKNEGGRRRVLEMSNWVWESDFGEIVPFDTEEFLIRLLRSPGGLFLIGDSLTSQHFMTIRHRLLKSSFFLIENHPSWPLHDHPDVYKYGLDTNHPNTHALLARIAERYPNLPPVPLERAKRPILTHIVDDTLVGPKELNKFFRTEMGYVHGWPKLTNVEDWVGFLDEMTMPREGEEGINENSLVTVTSGAHWSRAALHDYIPKTLPTKIIRARIEHAYAEMVRTIIPTLAPLRQTTVLFRSIAPGHSRCTQLTKPFLPAQSARGLHSGWHFDGRVTLEDWFSQKENQEPDVVEWDWDSFGARNLVWRDEIARYEEDRAGELWWEGEGETRGAKWIYLDFWNMDLQRGDAHTLTVSQRGRPDCLHYAMPYVHNQWTDILWHYLALNSKLEHGHIVAS
ncbi:hypothetical protein K435DRAFT_969573, partial [Dendrothele bispora CBS 962.96]